jgi:4-hydroxy-2-oxoheptanedioate aldolase
MVNTAEQARAFVSACRYPPEGQRSFGPIRSGLYGKGGDTAATNRDILVMPMIETRQALDNIEAILDVPGIDAIYVGPSDLGLSLGLEPKQDREEPEILKVYERLIAETSKRGLAAGIHTMSGAYSKRAFGMGFKLATIMNDSGLMLTAARAQVAAARG